MEAPTRKTSAAAMALPNSAEGRMLRTVLHNSKKRKTDNQSHVQAIKQLQGTDARNMDSPQSRLMAPMNASDDEEESRTASIKGKEKLSLSGPLFHDRPGNNSKARQAKKHARAASETVYPTPKDLVSATSSTRSAPPSPSKNLDVRPPYAIPPPLLEEEEEEEYGNGSNETAAALPEERVADPLADLSKNEAQPSINPANSPSNRKKRKREKQKQRARERREIAQGSASPMKAQDRLFGNSVLE